MTTDDGSAASTSASGAPSWRQLRFCDLVMKGGITSGVVDPLAVSEVARTDRFHNIGGTSAGAIAVAATAAAVHDRQHGGIGFTGHQRCRAGWALIPHAADLYERRGTAGALRDSLEIYAGMAPEICEDGPDGDPFHFTVTFALSGTAKVDEDWLRSIIEEEKPAHTTSTLRLEHR